MVVAGGREHHPVLLPDGSYVFKRLKDYKGRGVLTTATYEARKLGLSSGMPTMQAAKLAPDAVLLPTSFEHYKNVSARFKEVLRSVSPVLQDVGIDEAYLDLSALPESSVDLALQIKEKVLTATGLTCSVGIAPNKLLAKIASDLQKPDGFTLIGPEDLIRLIWPLPVEKLHGVGPKVSARLHVLGIFNVGDLAQFNFDVLSAEFGTRTAMWLHEIANGQDIRPVVQHRVAKSVSRETTFDHDMHVRKHRDRLTGILLALAEKLAEDLARKRCSAKTIGIKVRFSDFKSVTRDVTLDHVIASTEDIVQSARACLKKVPFEPSGAHSCIRLLGVKASNLWTQADLERELALREKRRVQDGTQLFLDLEDAP